MSAAQDSQWRCRPLQPRGPSRYVLLVRIYLDDWTTIRGWSSSWRYSEKQQVVRRLFPRTGDGASTAVHWRNQSVWLDVTQTEVRSGLHPLKRAAVSSQENCDRPLSSKNCRWHQYIQQLSMRPRYFEDTIHVFTRSHSKSKRSVCNHDIYVLPLDVQINVNIINVKIFYNEFIYNNCADCPLLDNRFAWRRGTRCPRMHISKHSKRTDDHLGNNYLLCLTTLIWVLYICDLYCI